MFPEIPVLLVYGSLNNVWRGTSRRTDSLVTHETHVNQGGRTSLPRSELPPRGLWRLLFPTDRSPLYVRSVLPSFFRKDSPLPPNSVKVLRTLILSLILVDHLLFVETDPAPVTETRGRVVARCELSVPRTSHRPWPSLLVPTRVGHSLSTQYLQPLVKGRPLGSPDFAPHPTQQNALRSSVRRPFVLHRLWMVLYSHHN